tara:strand:+ start:1728 stop:2069 length:342 start_codon:yes stop_codon:yes gene_type:complete
MSRYSKSKKLLNSSKYYRFLRKSRNDVKGITHYETPILYHPSLRDRIGVATTTHTWKVGDRYYNLANQYYGDPQLWWVIAWYNGLPTEGDVFPGDLITIPLDAEQILDLLGVD